MIKNRTERIIKECDNSKIYISSHFILSISLLIMFDTLLLRPSLHCNTTLLHFILSISLLTMFDTILLRSSPHCNTPLPFTTLHYTYRHFTSSHSTLHFLLLHFLERYFNERRSYLLTGICKRNIIVLEALQTI